MSVGLGIDSLPLSRQVISDLARAAMLAPAIHEVRPWRLQANPMAHTIDVYANPNDRLVRADPTGRIVCLTSGAAVLNVRLAAALDGREPIVRLLPEPSVPSLLVSVRLAGKRRCGPGEHELYEAMVLRPDAGPFNADPIPPAVLAELADAAQIEGALLHVLDSAEPARRTSTRPSPQLAVLTTRAAGIADQLRAGQAMERVLLTAALRGVSADLLDHLDGCTEPSQNTPSQAFVDWLGVEHPQLLFRLGYRELSSLPTG